MKKNGSKWDLPNKTRPEDNAPKKKHILHHENLNSKIPSLTNQPWRRHNEIIVDQPDPLHDLPRKDRHFTHIFLESLVHKEIIQKQHLKPTPSTHLSLDKKEKSTVEGFTRPMAGAPSKRGYENTINGGRKRFFYTS